MHNRIIAVLHIFLFFGGTMGEKRKYTKAEDLVGTTYKGFKVLDYKRENRRSFLQVECPYCKKIKWYNYKNRTNF